MTADQALQLGQSLRKRDQLFEFRLGMKFCSVGVIAVLHGCAIIETRRLQMPAQHRRDPDIVIGRWDGDRGYASSLGFVINPGAVSSDIAEAPPRAAAIDPRLCVRVINKPHDLAISGNDIRRPRFP